MGRKLIIRKEPTTSITAFAVDSMLLEDYQQSNESKTDALRRIFIAFFGEEAVKKKWKELQKKADRQVVIHGEQSRIDNMYFPKRTIKDCVYSRNELIDMIIEAKQLTGELKKRNADDSINKALTRGDIERIEGGFRIIRKWWQPMEIAEIEQAFNNG